MNRNLLRHGFLLILLSLVGAFFIPMMKIPRLGLSAHTIGFLSGLFLITLGIVWTQLSLSHRQKRVLYYSWLYSSYGNWFGCLFGAIVGAGRATPLAARGATGSLMVESFVTALLVSVGLVSLMGAALSLWGLRPGSGELPG